MIRLEGEVPKGMDVIPFCKKHNDVVLRNETQGVWFCNGGGEVITRQSQVYMGVGRALTWEELGVDDPTDGEDE